MAENATQTITGKEYSAFEQAYNWFNTKLFAGTLPPCLITLQRQARSYGYFARARFQHRTVGDHAADELALNPDTFADRSDKDILSTLAHEMVHCWQQHWGTPPRRGYHDKTWAAKMVAIGLMPSDTGEPSGKQTGQHMDHYIIPDGPFDQATDALLSTGFALHWQSLAFERQEGKKGSKRSKTKYQCPACGQNAWAKPTAQLLCGACMVRMAPEVP